MVSYGLSIHCFFFLFFPAQVMFTAFAFAYASYLSSHGTLEIPWRHSYTMLYGDIWASRWSGEDVYRHIGLVPTPLSFDLFAIVLL